jgi:hypothetical protein
MKCNDIKNDDLIKENKRKEEEKKKIIDSDPYSNYWIKRKGRSIESFQVEKVENVDYGTYTTSSDTPDLESLEPSKLPKSLSQKEAIKLVAKIIEYYRKKNYVLKIKNKHINLVGIRTPINTKINHFNDFFVLFWWDDEKNIENVSFKIYKITTVPGLDCRKGINSMNKTGCGWLVEKQYKYVLGSTHGYECLRPTNDQVAYRSRPNSKGLLIPEKKNNKILLNKKRNLAMLIHKSSWNGEKGKKVHPKSYQNPADISTKTIGSWSYGCQVFARYDNYLELLSYCHDRKEKNRQTKFLYTIILEKDLK